MSITLDKFIQVKASLYDDPNDPRVEEWCRHWASRPGFDKLDSIRLTEMEADRFVDPLREMKMDSVTLMEQPALREFELVVREPIPSLNMTVVRYRKTVLPKEPVVIHESSDGRIEATPYIDAFLSFRNSTEVDSVMSIFTFYAFDANGKVRGTGTLQKEFWRNHDLMLNYSIDKDYSLFTETLRDIKLVYLGIQKAMYDKPVIFSEASGETRPQDGNSERKNHGRRKVKIAKTIHVNKEELKKYAEPHKHMTCPCWGVIGHWRTYKTGKQVWIAPYRKGRKRDDISTYEPKDYECMKEGTVCS